MQVFDVDLTNCDREPIHIPGKIQSHGFMLVLDSDFKIRFHSDNLRSFIPDAERSLLGKPIEYFENFIENAAAVNVLSQLLHLGNLNGYEQINPYYLIISGVRYDLIFSRSGKFAVLEFEPHLSTVEVNVEKMIGRSVSEMLADKSLQKLLNNTATQIKQIIQYDRVMIYRFAGDGHGEVIAEAKNTGLESWLYLHFPASDIPKQARELYKINLIRLIADVNCPPTAISTDPSQSEPLDLSWSQLRAVSPIHIQYLKNMGVASSFSISLLYKGELWGLVACHNYTPRFIDFKSRESAKLIGQILSSALEFRQDEENKMIHDRYEEKLDRLAKYLQGNEAVGEALTTNPVTVLELTTATGVAVIYDKQIFRIGTTPGEIEIGKLVEWIDQSVKEPVYSCTNLTELYPPAASYQHIASGILVAELTRELREYCIWFKPERVEVMKWAGDPEKPMEMNAQNLLQLSPRQSFAVWLQDVRGRCENWSFEELASGRRLIEEINYAVNLKAGALRLLNERLRLAYDDLDAFSFTISHDLKGPIATIKGFAQLLDGADSFGEQERSMVGKIIERANKMNSMIGKVLNYSRIGRGAVEFEVVDMRRLIREIVGDLELIYNTAKYTISIGETPVLKGDPVMLSQVFANLISNAVKYSQDVNDPVILIEGRVGNDECCYLIRDNGLGIAEKDMPRIFDLFNRMENVSHIEGSGVGLAIVKRIVERHKGRIWAESELRKGSVFYVAFPS